MAAEGAAWAGAGDAAAAADGAGGGDGGGGSGRECDSGGGVGDTDPQSACPRYGLTPCAGFSGTSQSFWRPSCSSQTSPVDSERRGHTRTGQQGKSKQWLCGDTIQVN